MKLTIQTSTNHWLELLESGIQAAAVFFFDFTKAFDSVSHKALIGKLQAWMCTLWNARILTPHKPYEYVVVNGVSSKPLHVISSGQLLNYHYHLRVN